MLTNVRNKILKYKANRLRCKFIKNITSNADIKIVESPYWVCHYANITSYYIVYGKLPEE